jgi:multiple sugar transport system ATP-binding protein
MAKLEIEKLTKEFGDGSIVAVENLDLDVDDGEFVVVVGPSGCGKSTTLNTIAGLERPTSGSLSLSGEEITSKPPQERDTAMVFQNYALYPHMDVESNIGFGLRMSSDIGKEERKQRVQDTAELLQIEDLLDQRPAELSGGQQQRVALGRAIVREPSVFLMDEPLSNLDAKLRSEMRTEIQKLQNSLDITTIYVTHDQTEAMTMSDRIAIMNDGELQQVATPQEVYHEPANQFVAGFIGEPSMNFFNVENASSNDEALRFVNENLTYEMPSAGTLLFDAPTDLVLGVRPSHIRLSDDPDFRAEVQVVEPMGEYDLVHIEFGGKSYTVKIEGEKAPPELSVAGFSISEDQVHLFDRATGETLHNPKRREVPA